MKKADNGCSAQPMERQAMPVAADPRATTDIGVKRSLAGDQEKNA
jgi:hypothetical protein